MAGCARSVVSNFAGSAAACGLLALAALSSGCLELRAGLPGGAAPVAAYCPTELATLELAAADVPGREEKEAFKRGGLVLAFQRLPFTDLSTKGSGGGVTVFGLSSPDVMYGQMFDDGFGFYAGFVLRRPPSGMVSQGDSYVVGALDFQGFQGTLAEVEDMSLVGFWLDVKTMLNPPSAAKRAIKPFVRYGLGLVSISAVGAGMAGDLYDATLAGGLRGGFGLDIGPVFVDFGAQITSPPAKGGTGDVGEAEPMFVVPVRLGVSLTF